MHSGPLHGRRPIKPKNRSSERAVRLKAVQPAQSEGVRVRLNQPTPVCQLSCRCSCHASSKCSTPTIVDRIVDQLFVHYAGLPLLNKKCDMSGCQKSQTPHMNIEYWFPLGIFNPQILRIQADIQSHPSPQFSLSTFRRVPDSAQCVTYALTGNIDGLKDLFNRGLASPKNVSSTRGYSVLRVTLWLAAS